MTGTITYILSRAGYRAMNGPLADERRRLAGADAPSAYVSYDPRLLAGAGWYGYRIAFKGGDRQMIERSRYMLSERYTIRESYEYFSDGVYVIGVLLRQRVKLYGIGSGVEPTPEPDALNFYMPNGGTISLNKIGSPTVVELEYSLDGGATWTVWAEDGSGNRSLTLTAGQRMYVRNTSETSTEFSVNSSNRYQFTFSDDVYADGELNSLICKNPGNAVVKYCILYGLFHSCTQLITAPKLSFETAAYGCYCYLFAYCTNLTSSFELKPTRLYSLSYYGMFTGCRLVNNIKVYLTDISASNCLTNWLNNVSPTGDFYCPAELTIPTGASGIPSGWTRHDV